MRLLGVFLLLILLSACDDSYDHGPHHDDHGTHHDDYPKLTLKSFHLIDSLGHDSKRHPTTELELDPYIDGGAFELIWHVDYFGRARVGVHDYTAEFFINDRPSLLGSKRIASELCGPGLACSSDGMQYCRYNKKFKIACDMYETPDKSKGRYMGDLIAEVPEKLYLLMEICSSYEGKCELDYVPVTVR